MILSMDRIGAVDGLCNFTHWIEVDVVFHECCLEGRSMPSEFPS